MNPEWGCDCDLKKTTVKFYLYVMHKIWAFKEMLFLSEKKVK